jgi:hypothetical protein
LIDLKRKIFNGVLLNTHETQTEESLHQKKIAFERLAQSPTPSSESRVTVTANGGKVDFLEGDSGQVVEAVLEEPHLFHSQGLGLSEKTKGLLAGNEFVGLSQEQKDLLLLKDASWWTGPSAAGSPRRWCCSVCLCPESCWRPLRDVSSPHHRP